MSINQCSINSNQVEKFINTFSPHYQVGAGLEHAPPVGVEGVTNLRQSHHSANSTLLYSTPQQLLLDMFSSSTPHNHHQLFASASAS